MAGIVIQRIRDVEDDGSEARLPVWYDSLKEETDILPISQVQPSANQQIFDFENDKEFAWGAYPEEGIVIWGPPLIDAEAAAEWDITQTYDLGDIVQNGGHHWKSIQEDNQGQGPAVGGGWWQTATGPKKIFDLDSNAKKRYSRFRGNSVLISPQESKELFAKLQSVAVDQVVIPNKNHWMLKYQALESTSISNPYNKRYDYSTMGKAFGWIMKYYGAYSMLESLKEKEAARQNAIDKWNERNQTYLEGDESWRDQAYNQAWQRQYIQGGSYTEIGLVHCNDPLNDACLGEITIHNGIWRQALGDPMIGQNWQTTSESLNKMESLFNKTLYENETHLEHLFPGGWDPASSTRFVAYGNGLDGFAANLNATGAVDAAGVGNWNSLNPTNSYWDQSNFLNPANHPGTKPQNLSFATSKKALKAFLIFGACVAGVGVGARLLGALFRDDGASYSKGGFETTTAYASHTSRLLAKSTGESALTSWVKDLIQEHDPTQFLMDGYTGGVSSIKTLVSATKKLFGIKYDDAGNEIKDNYVLQDVSLNGNPSTAKVGDTLIVTTNGKDPEVEAVVRVAKVSSGKVTKVNIENSGRGYAPGKLFRGGEIPLTLTIRDSDNNHIGTGVLFDENAYVLGKFYRIAYGTLLENVKELRTNLDNFVQIAGSKKTKGFDDNKWLKPPQVNNKTQNPWINGKMTWKRRKDYLVTYKSAATGKIIPSAIKPADEMHEVWICSNGGSIDNTDGALPIPDSSNVSMYSPSTSGVKAKKNSTVIEVGPKPLIGQKVKFLYGGRAKEPWGSGVEMNAQNVKGDNKHYDFLQYYETLISRLDGLIQVAGQTISGEYKRGIGSAASLKSLDSGRLMPTFRTVIGPWGDLREVIVESPGWGKANIGAALKIGSGEITDPNTLRATGGTNVTVVNNEQKFKNVRQPAKGGLEFSYRLEGVWDNYGKCLGVKVFKVIGNSEKLISDSTEGSKVKDTYYFSTAETAWLGSSHWHSKEAFNFSEWAGNSRDFDLFFIVNPAVTLAPQLDSSAIRMSEPENPQSTVQPTEPGAVKEEPGTISSALRQSLLINEINGFTSANALDWQYMYNAHFGQFESIFRLISSSFKVAGSGMVNLLEMKNKKGQTFSNVRCAPIATRGIIYKALNSLGNNKGGTNTTPSTLTESERLKIASMRFFTPTFGKCDVQRIKGLSKHMANSYFSNRSAYNLFTAPGKIQESVCGKYSCGAVHAYTQVPPIGLSLGVEENGIDGAKENPLNICGNATITFRFFPTLNTAVTEALTQHPGIPVKGFTKLACNSTVKPQIYHTIAGASTSHLAAYNGITLNPFDKHLGRDVTDVVPRVGDIGLPEIWGNWTNSEFSGYDGGEWKEGWTGGMVQGALSHSNPLSYLLNTVLSLFTQKHLPNLAIWNLAQPSKQGEESWTGYHNQMEALGYTLELRTTYDNIRLMKFGWGPYGHELSNKTSVGVDQAVHNAYLWITHSDSQDAPGWGHGQESTAILNYGVNEYWDNKIRYYHLLHMGKVFQGMYADLNKHVKTWKRVRGSNHANSLHDKDSIGGSNIHPAKYNTAQGYAVEYDNVRGKYPVIYKGLDPVWPIEATSFQEPVPLSITRTLSGICYPVINAHSKLWLPMVMMVKADDLNSTDPFEGWEHWGQQGVGSDSTHSAFGENNHSSFSFTPSSWEEKMSRASAVHSFAFKENSDYGKMWGWSLYDPDEHGANITIDSKLKSIKAGILKEKGIAVNDANIKIHWGEAAETKHHRFPVREYQEMRAHDENPLEEELDLYNAGGSVQRPRVFDERVEYYEKELVTYPHGSNPPGQSAEIPQLDKGLVWKSKQIIDGTAKGAPARPPIKTTQAGEKMIMDLSAIALMMEYEGPLVNHGGGTVNNVAEINVGASNVKFEGLAVGDIVGFAEDVYSWIMGVVTEYTYSTGLMKVQVTTAHWDQALDPGRENHLWVLYVPDHNYWEQQGGVGSVRFESDQTQGQRNAERLDNPNKDPLKAIRPKYDHCFPSDPVWAPFAKELDEQIGRWSLVFPRVYIDSYGFHTMLKDQDIPVNYPATDPSDDQVIDFHKFVKEYIKADMKIIATKKHQWQEEGKWSAWQSAYEKEVKGKWGIQGTGSNLIQAKADFSGQALLYGELINKFHYVGGTAIHEKENLDVSLIEGWGGDDVIEATAYGMTEQEAKDRATLKLKEEIKTRLYEYYSQTPLVGGQTNACNQPFEGSKVCDTDLQGNPIVPSLQDCSEETTQKFNPCSLTHWVNPSDPIDNFALISAVKENDENDQNRNGQVLLDVIDGRCQAEIDADPDPSKAGHCRWSPNTAQGYNKIMGTYLANHASEQCGSAYIVEEVCLEPTKDFATAPFNNLYGFDCQAMSAGSTKEEMKLEALKRLAYGFANQKLGQPIGQDAGDYPVDSADEKCGCDYKDGDQVAFTDPNAAFHEVNNLWNETLVQGGNPLIGVPFLGMLPGSAIPDNPTNPYFVEHLSFSDYIADSTTLGGQAIAANPSLYNYDQANGVLSAFGSTEQESTDRVKGIWGMFTGVADNPAYKKYYGTKEDENGDVIEGLLTNEHSSTCACEKNITASEANWANMGILAMDQTNFQMHLEPLKNNYNTDANGDKLFQGWMSNCGDPAGVVNSNGYTGEFCGTPPGDQLCDDQGVLANWKAWGETGIVNIPVNAGIGDTTVWRLYDCIREKAFNNFKTIVENYLPHDIGHDKPGITAYDDCQDEYGNYMECDGNYQKTAGGCYNNIAEMLVRGQGNTNPGTPLYSSSANKDLLIAGTCNINVTPGSEVNFDPGQWHFNRLDQSAGDCGCDWTEMCGDPVDAAHNLPPGYKCYGRVVSESRTVEIGDNTTPETADINLSLYEQVISGKTTSPDGRSVAGIISQTYWGTLEHVNWEVNGPKSWKTDMNLVGCDTYAAELTGKCAVLNKDCWKATVSGALGCGTQRHKYKMPLFKNSYSGIMFASGLAPWVTGSADWTNAGVTLWQQKGKVTELHPKGENLSVAKLGEQEYIVNYGAGEGGWDLEYPHKEKKKSLKNTPNQGANVKTNKKRLLDTIPKSKTTQHNEATLAQAWRGEWKVYQESWAKVKYTPRIFKMSTVDKDGNVVSKDKDGLTYSATGKNAGTWSGKPISEIKDVKAEHAGDLVWMGGWELINPAWDTTITNIGHKSRAANKVLGVNIVIFDPSRSNGKAPKNIKSGGGKNKKVKALRFARDVDLGRYKITAAKQVFTHRKKNIIAVFYDEQAYNDYLSSIHQLRNVEVQDFGGIAGAEKACTYTSPGDSPAHLAVQWAILKGNIAACEHCLATEIKKGHAAELAEANKMMFGEQFLLGRKVKWDIYKGNAIFTVPYTIEKTVEIENPIDNQSPIKVYSWQDKVRPRELEFDPELERVHYSLVTNAFNVPYPPSIPCNSYSKYDKVVDFNAWSDRAWTEIPKGGMIEVVNGVNKNPIYVGPTESQLGGTHAQGLFFDSEVYLGKNYANNYGKWGRASVETKGFWGSVSNRGRKVCLDRGGENAVTAHGTYHGDHPDL